jgi:hypothetical protein
MLVVGQVVFGQGGRDDPKKFILTAPMKSEPATQLPVKTNAAVPLHTTFGPMDFGRTAANGTAYKGHAESGERNGAVTTYRGVTIYFPASQSVIQADQVIENSTSKELVFSGTVRLKFDLK